MARRRTQKPGEKPSGTGTYEEVGPRGGKVYDSRTADISKNTSHMPPTQESKRKWKPKQKNK